MTDLLSHVQPAEQRHSLSPVETLLQMAERLARPSRGCQTRLNGLAVKLNIAPSLPTMDGQERTAAGRLHPSS